MATQGLFKRNDTFVVVRRIRLGGEDWIEPGTEITRGDYRLHRLIAWHRRRMIGKKGTQWVEMMLKAGGRHYFLPELGREPKPKKGKPVQLQPVKVRNGKWSVPGVEEVFKTKKAAMAHIETMKETG